MARHANVPAWLWVFLWFYAILLENTTKPYKPGADKTPFEVRNGRPFDNKKLPPFGCYAIPHVKKHKRRPGKPADQAKPGIFIGYGHHKRYSSCLILDPKT
eukprot:1567747-Rhodomonas_salina.1